MDKNFTKCHRSLYKLNELIYLTNHALHNIYVRLNGALCFDLIIEQKIDKTLTRNNMTFLKNATFQWQKSPRVSACVNFTICHWTPNLWMRWDRAQVLLIHDCHATIIPSPKDRPIASVLVRPCATPLHPPP